MRHFLRKFISWRHTRTSGVLIATVAAWCNLCCAQTQAAKYYRVTDIAAGQLSIRSMRVTSAVVQSVDPGSGTETVVLHLSAGALTLVCGVGGNPCLTGAILRLGKQEVGWIRGRFAWQGNTISSANLTDMQFQLSDATLGTKLLGGILEPDRSAQVAIKVGSPIDISSSSHTGSLNITVPSGQVRGLNCTVGGLAIKTDLRVEEPADLELTLSDGSIKLKKGKLATKGLAIGDAGTGIQLYQTLQKGPVSIKNLTLSIAPDQFNIQDIVAEDPGLTHTDFASVRIVGAVRLIATGVTGKASITDSGVQVSNLKSESFRIVPDALEIAGRLNQHWIQDSDDILPTGDTNIRYIKLSALDSLYRQLADAELNQPDQYRIYLHTSNDVVTAAQVETIPNIALSGNVDTPKICLVFDGPVSGANATVAATYILNMAVPIMSIRTQDLVALRQLATVLGPTFGMPPFFTVLGSTKGLTSPSGSDMNQFVVNPTHQYSELLLGTGQSPRVLVLPAPHDGFGTREIRMVSRYQAYVSTIKTAGLQMAGRNTSNIYKLLQRESSLRVQYRQLVRLRASAWTQNHQSDLAKLKAAEAGYSQATATQKAEDQRHNAAVVGTEVRQMEDRRARLKAIQDTVIVSTPAAPIDGYPGTTGYTVKPCNYPGKVPNYAGTSGTEAGCK